LCDESLLLIKTKKAHWDVVGPQFLTLHKLLDSQYEKVAEYGDSVAERVRALGGFPVGTAAGFLAGATVKEAPGTLDLATDAVSHLLDDHETIIRGLREKARICEEKHGDRGTSDFLVALMQGHEEMAWMLRSFL
jgi:starvation-inducible DNA-binding protein